MPRARPLTTWMPRSESPRERSPALMSPRLDERRDPTTQIAGRESAANSPLKKSSGGGSGISRRSFGYASSEIDTSPQPPRSRSFTCSSANARSGAPTARPRRLLRRSLPSSLSSIRRISSSAAPREMSTHLAEPAPRAEMISSHRRASAEQTIIHLPCDPELQFSVRENPHRRMSVPVVTHSDPSLTRAAAGIGPALRACSLTLA
jgi:hypothetical protein